MALNPGALTPQGTTGKWSTLLFICSVAGLTGSESLFHTARFNARTDASGFRERSLAVVSTENMWKQLEATQVERHLPTRMTSIELLEGLSHGSGSYIFICKRYESANGYLTSMDIDGAAQGDRSRVGRFGPRGGIFQL